MNITDEAVQAAQATYMTFGIDDGMMREALTAAAPYMSGSAREQALDLSVLERLAKIADEYDEPDENGPFPDIQDAMISIRDLRQIRQLLAAIRALKSQPAQTGWEPIETAPKDEIVLLTWLYRGEWEYEVGLSYSSKGGWYHGSATHWMPLPTTAQLEDAR